MELTTISFDMTQTLFIAVLLLLFGNYIVRHTTFFAKFCIPGAVVGGLIFSIITLILRQTEIIGFKFDTTLQQFFMNLFFTASGFGASMSLLKKGGKRVLIFLGLAALLAFLQNLLSVGMAGVVGLEPMIALMTGSIPLTGGHGNAASFGPLAEEMGFAGANAVAVASATYGLVTGALMGGPVASHLIKKYNLFTQEVIDENKMAETEKTEEDNKFSAKKFKTAFNLIFIGLGLGSVFFIIFKKLMPNVTLPIHVMGMLGGVLIRIAMDQMKVDVPEKEIDAIGDVCLGVFVSMAIYTMKLWELIELAVPIIIILLVQLILIYLFVRYLTFPLMGKDFDAAVIVAGHIGFGLGAVPVSMANMNALSEKYVYSKVAYFIVPIVGALFSNFTNAAIITMFMNWCK